MGLKARRIAGETFRRGQVLHAAWNLFKRTAETSDPQPVFTNRLKHLLNFDRTIEPERVPGSLGYAFYGETPQGTGVEARYTTLDVLCLLIALELVDLAFPQAEAIQVIRGFRAALAGHYQQFLKSPPLAEPTFFILSRSELVEAWDGHEKFKNGVKLDSPGILPGYDTVTVMLQKTHYRRKMVLIEIGEYMRKLADELRRAPAKKRGR